jgi:hypothetical protein
MGRREELLRAEAEGWEELNELISRADPETLERAGLNAEGWAVRDLMWHVAYWCADTAQVFGRMRDGIFDAAAEPEGPGEIDPINDAQLERSKGTALDEVRGEWFRARAAMLERFGELAELTPEADQWFDETGPLHYAKHLSDLRTWLGTER